MQRGKKPYIELGKKLLEIRRSLKESLPEVSSAVELDVDIIEAYEKGEARPSEDVLSMLISHFDIREDEADELWELAGYIGTTDAGADVAMDISHSMPIMPTVVVVPMESKILYTDKVNVSVNNQGVVLGFIQESINPGQGVPVSRVGMSLTHAKNMIRVMQKTIDKFEDSRPKSDDGLDSRL